MSQSLDLTHAIANYLYQSFNTAQPPPKRYRNEPASDPGPFDIFHSETVPELGSPPSNSFSVWDEPESPSISLEELIGPDITPLSPTIHIPQVSDSVFHCESYLVDSPSSGPDSPDNLCPGYSQSHSPSESDSLQVPMSPEDDSKKVKRPMNSFLLFSNEMRPRLQNQHMDQPNAEISKMLGQVWKNMTADQKAPYVTQAAQIKRDFDASNPNYVYTKSSKQKCKKRKRSSAGTSKIPPYASMMSSMNLNAPSISASSTLSFEC